MNGTALGMLLRREFLRPSVRPHDYLGRIALAATLASAMPFAAYFAPFGHTSAWVLVQVALIGFVMALGQAHTLRVELARELTERSYGFLLLSDLGVRGALSQCLARRVPALTTLTLMMLVPLTWAWQIDTTRLTGWHVLAIPTLIVAAWIALSGICAIGAALWPGSSGGDLLLIGYLFRLGILSFLSPFIPFAIRFLIDPTLIDERVLLALIGMIGPLCPITLFAVWDYVAEWPIWLAAILALALEGAILLRIAAPLLAWRERRQGIRSWKARLQDWYRERTWYHKPPITDDQAALTWRDYVFIHGGPRFSFWMIVISWLVALGLIVMVRKVIGLDGGDIDGDPWSVILMHIMTFWGICAAATLPVVYVSQASRAWEMDRNSHALELLLLTPLGGREIALAKLKAVWMVARLPLVLVLLPGVCFPPADIAFSELRDGRPVPWRWILTATGLMLVVGAWFAWMLLLANFRLGLVRKAKKRTFTIGPLNILLMGGIALPLVKFLLSLSDSETIVTVGLILWGLILVGALVSYHWWLHQLIFRDLRETMLEVASRSDEG